MKKGLVFINILIQLCWYTAAGTATYLITKMYFSWLIQPWRTIVGVLIFVAIVALLTLITNVTKATSDPEVKISSELKIPFRRYKRYREWYDEYQRLMMRYGIESKEAQQFFINFFKQIKNPNEWRRYSLYRQKRFEVQRDREIQRSLGKNIGWELGDRITIEMDDGTYNFGTITSIDNQNQVCTIEFLNPVSFIEKDEPEDSFSDNPYPRSKFRYPFSKLDDIAKQKYYGTTKCFHFANK